MRQHRDGTAEPGDPRQVDRLRTRLGMVFQSFNLWSHMTVLENVVEAPVHVLKVAKAEAEGRALALLDKVGISDKRNHYPAHLSGGQRDALQHLQRRKALVQILDCQGGIFVGHDSLGCCCDSV